MVSKTNVSKLKVNQTIGNILSEDLSAQKTITTTKELYKQVGKIRRKSSISDTKKYVTYCVNSIQLSIIKLLVQKNQLYLKELQ